MANDKEATPGDEMEDGTIYAGISPVTKKPMYVTPQDAPGAYTFNQAATYAQNLNANGHQDFRVPSYDELDVLYRNRNKGKLAGTFNETGSNHAGWYWSSTEDAKGLAWAERFSDGGTNADQYEFMALSLRCVR